MSRQKLVINLSVIIMCGIIALSIPVLVNHLPKSAHASGNLVLDSVRSDNDLFDTNIGWQLVLRRGDKIVQTWDEIYQTIQNHTATLDYDETVLKLTSQGLFYTKTTVDNFSTVVTYQNYHCELNLA